MRRLRRFLLRLRATVTRRRDDERLREDLEDHLAFQTEANVRAGMPVAEARRQAVLAMGPMAAIQEDFYDERRLPSLEHLLQDLRLALRRMKQAPGFTAAAIATLALGLGLNSAVLSLAYGVFLKPLPVDEPSRLVIAGRFFTGDARRGFPVSYPEYVHYRDHARAFSDLAAHYSTSPMRIITPGGPFNVMGSVVTANYFGLLRLQPAMGRFFLPDEDAVPGRNPVADQSGRYITKASTIPSVGWLNAAGSRPTISNPHDRHRRTARSFELTTKLNCIALNPLAFARRSESSHMARPIPRAPASAATT
jgi:hypothetical protein